MPSPRAGRAGDKPETRRRTDEEHGEDWEVVLPTCPAADFPAGQHHERIYGDPEHDVGRRKNSLRPEILGDKSRPKCVCQEHQEENTEQENTGEDTGDIPATPGHQKLREDDEDGDDVKTPENSSRDLVNTQLTPFRQGLETRGSTKCHPNRPGYAEGNHGANPRATANQAQYSQGG